MAMFFEFPEVEEECSEKSKGPQAGEQSGLCEESNCYDPRESQYASQSWGEWGEQSDDRDRHLEYEEIEEPESSTSQQSGFSAEHLKMLRSLGAVTLTDLKNRNPEPLPLVVEGLLEAGQLATFIGSSKAGKTMALLDLAAVMQNGGGQWLGRRVVGGNVLYIDLELQDRKIVERFSEIYEARGFKADSSELPVWPLRNEMLNIDQIAKKIRAKVTPGFFNLIILDSLYLAMPDGSESSDETMKRACKAARRIAGHTGAAVILTHHSTKGNQATKDITDVGGGHNTLGRFADAHCILRKHSQDGMYVFEAVLRNFEQEHGKPQTWQFEFPLWKLRPDVEPVLAAGKSNSEVRNKEKSSESESLVYKAVCDHPNLTVSAYRKLAAKPGCASMGKEAVEKALKALIRKGKVIHDANTDTYAPSKTSEDGAMPF
jgi:hypothetical protein